MTCVFCDIIAGDAPAKVLAEFVLAVGAEPFALAIEPLKPVVPGHAIIIHRQHTSTAVEDPALTGVVTECAAQFATRYSNSNIIMNVGAEAGQTVFHLHVHVVPRATGDGLIMPWDAQHNK